MATLEFMDSSDSSLSSDNDFQQDALNTKNVPKNVPKKPVATNVARQYSLGRQLIRALHRIYLRRKSQERMPKPNHYFKRRSILWLTPKKRKYQTYLEGLKAVVPHYEHIRYKYDKLRKMRKIHPRIFTQKSPLTQGNASATKKKTLTEESYKNRL